MKCKCGREVGESTNCQMYELCPTCNHAREREYDRCMGPRTAQSLKGWDHDGSKEEKASKVVQ